MRARNCSTSFVPNTKPDGTTDAGIVYCLSRRKVEETAEWLKEQGMRALPYHAGMEFEIRQQHQQMFSARRAS